MLHAINNFPEAHHYPAATAPVAAATPVIAAPAPERQNQLMMHRNM